MGKWCLHASSFIFDRIIIKVAGNRDRHKSSDEFNFGPLVSMAHLYVLKMRFDLGTLDSGEQSLPFQLLVFDLILFIPPPHPAKQSLRGYTVFSMSMILSFRQHLRLLLFNFDSFCPILFKFTPHLNHQTMHV